MPAAAAKPIFGYKCFWPRYLYLSMSTTRQWWSNRSKIAAAMTWQPKSSCRSPKLFVEVMTVAERPQRQETNGKGRYASMLSIGS